MTPQDRQQESYKIRVDAAKIALARPLEPQECNGDESIPCKPMSFTKGLAHDFKTGLLQKEADFKKFVKGVDTGNPADFIATPLGPRPANDWKSKKDVKVRAWESQGAGHTFDLEGPDAQSVAMPPAPKLGSDELTAEMAEVYAQALLRDIPFSVFYDKANSRQKDKKRAKELIDALNKIPFFRDGKRNGKTLNLENAFRGFTRGDLVGPYISQFLLAGGNGLNESGDPTPELDAEDGKVSYGAITINQRVRTALPGKNYMTNWKEWYDVQNGADFRGLEKYRGNDRRFITTGRDLATYVHYDALYEAYLNACLILLDAKIDKSEDCNDPANFKFDAGIPFQRCDKDDHQQGFVNFGGPHILTLVTEVATRALKAVRFQKYNIHRRTRPEGFAARFEKLNEVKPKIGDDNAEKLQKSYDALEDAGIFKFLRKENECNLLLPMAFVEGSPMHPSYGAGHATVAGACVTILKAFFNTGLYINVSKDGDKLSLSKDKKDSKFAFIPSNNGKKLKTVSLKEAITVEGELNKEAANISIGRDWAGVHYYTDYSESLKMGEKIAIGLLQEQSITYLSSLNLSMTLSKFDGSKVVIKNGTVT